MLNIIENIIIFVCVVSAIMVLLAKQPIQSLLSLILSFGMSSIVFMILGAEFLSLLIFIVYIGAIAVMFLFVIMMLNVKVVELRSFYLKYLPVGIFIILFFFFELFIYIYYEFIFFFNDFFYVSWIDFLDFKGNIYLLGSIIYSNYFILFLFLALILFISMLGSIILLVNWLDKKQTLINKEYYFESFNKNKINNLYISYKDWK
jgi:NADH-quinone oxidoreductase subunit J